MKPGEKSERSGEKDAVFTTIVGGRPPGSGTQIGTIPRGIEVLIKKASVDPEFRSLLLEKRAEAAKEINLKLTKAEQTMLSSISMEQLEKIIDNTKVSTEHRKTFLGTTAVLMLAAVTGLTVVSINSCPSSVATAGISPDRVRKMQMEGNINPIDANEANEPNEERTNLDDIHSDQAKQVK